MPGAGYRLQLNIERSMPAATGTTVDVAVRGRRAVAPLLVSTLLVVACGGGGGFPDAPVVMPPQDPGTVALSWTLVGAGSAAPETCTMANGMSVVVAIAQEGTSAQFGQTFPCSLGVAVSGSLPTATYDLMFALYDPNNALLATGWRRTAS